MLQLNTKNLPVLFTFILATVIVFRRFFFDGLLPIPGDILIGAYYPWLDDKWGFITGVPVKNPLPSDVISILYPWRILAISILKSGSLPLWDNTSLLGTPLLANFQAAILNPLNILFFFLSERYAWSIQVILQPIFISLAMYLYLKNLNLGKFSAIFGSLAFAFCGFSVVWLEYNTIGYTLIFIPMSFLLVDKIVKNPKIIYAFLLGLSWSLQVFSGYPQVSLYTIAFSSLYFLYRLCQNENFSVSKILVCILAGASAISLAAVQILPSMELLDLSIRSVDKTTIGGEIQFLPIGHLITVFAPDFFGNPATGNYWSSGSYDNFTFYIVIVALFFFIHALLKRLVFNKTYFIFLLFICLSLVLAIANPISQFFVEKNILGLQSAVATRILIMFDFSVIVIATLGFNHFQAHKIGVGYKLLPLFIITVLLFAGLEFYSFNPVAIRNSIFPVALLSATTFTGLFLVRFKRLFPIIVIGLLIFEITRNTDKYMTFIKPALLYPSVDVLTDLKTNLVNSRFEREKAEILPSNTWVPYGLKAAGGQNALYPLSSSIYLTLVDNNPANMFGRYVDLNNYESPLYDTLDIKYLLVLNRDEKTSVPSKDGQPFKQFLNPKFSEFRNYQSVRVLEHTTNLGRAWFSNNTFCINNEEKIANILLAKEYNPRDTLIVNCRHNNFTNKAIGSVQVKANSPNYTKFEISNPSNNYLTISQAFYPGWNAYIDGEKTEINRANIALTAVLIPEGNHTLELKYQPNSFHTGLKISLAALFLWIAFFCFKLIGVNYRTPNR